MTSLHKIALLQAGAAFTAPIMAQTAPPTTAEVAAPALEAEAAAENEIVVGSRLRARTYVDRPVPVDVIAAGDPRATGQIPPG